MNVTDFLKIFLLNFSLICNRFNFCTEPIKNLTFFSLSQQISEECMDKKWFYNVKKRTFTIHNSSDKYSGNCIQK